MVRAEDLRIGNIVWCGYNCTRCEITGILPPSYHPSFDGVHVSTSMVWVNFECIDPIPLTEEWLVKLGFESRTENAGNLPCFKRGNITVARWSGGKWQVWYKTVDLFKSTQSVHQLQNLYFALIGEELTLKP